MKLTKKQIKTLWRTKYPWIFVFYILAFGILRGILVYTEPLFALNVMMIASFTSFIFLYIFYLYGVRPDEIEHWHKK